jgi:hypothetical protein
MLTAAAVTLALSLMLPSAASAATTSSSSTALTPIREASAKYGADVKWNQKTHTITITKDDSVIVLVIGKNGAIVNGKQVAMDHPVTVVSGRALADSKFIDDLFKDSQQSSDPADLFVDALQSGNGAQAAQYVSESFAATLPQNKLNVLWSDFETILGKMKLTGAKTEKTNSVHRNVTYAIQAGTVSAEITIRLNLSGLIDDLNIALATNDSSYLKPSYDKADSYTEQEVTVGQGDLALPGTLTLPKGEGPFPAVVLVHGSGAQDRDVTFGGAKPFRDLAAGLASQGIAVLRYDKVTYEHTYKTMADPKFTLKKETVDDALSAVKLLKDNTSIDTSRIFVIGHSQGGYAMPLLISADTNKDVAGTVLLAGPSGKFVDAVAEQQQGLVKRVKELGIDATAYEQQAAQYTVMANMVNDPQYSVDHMPEQFPFQPAYWFFEQKNYVPADLAKGQNVPMLILQGENDWQVTMNQFEGWKTALKDRTNVEFKSYPNVNHLLAEYKGVSIGAEYVNPSNVSKEIIDDIASWIKGIK